MTQADQEPLPSVERQDVQGVLVRPDGSKLLLLKLPTWMRLYMTGGAAFFIVLGLAATNWNWGALLLVGAGAILMYLGVMLYPQGLFHDPAKPHHWPKDRS